MDDPKGANQDAAGAPGAAVPAGAGRSYWGTRVEMVQWWSDMLDELKSTG